MVYLVETEDRKLVAYPVSNTRIIYSCTVCIAFQYFSALHCIKYLQDVSIDNNDKSSQ